MGKTGWTSNMSVNTAWDEIKERTKDGRATKEKDYSPLAVKHDVTRFAIERIVEHIDWLESGCLLPGQMH